MKIKRYFAPDIRQAMRMVREEQGPDAVILSNRRVEGGVEIVAALDFDEQALEQKLSEQAVETAPLKSAAAPAPAPAQPQTATAATAAAAAPAPRGKALAEPRSEPAEAAKPHAPQPSAATVELLARLRGGAGPASPAKRETPAAAAPAPAPAPAKPALAQAPSRPAAPRLADYGAEPQPRRPKPAAAPVAAAMPAATAPAKEAAALRKPELSREDAAAFDLDPFAQFLNAPEPQAAPAAPAPTQAAAPRKAPPPIATASVPAAPAEDSRLLAELKQELRSLRKTVDMRLAEAGWQAATRHANVTRLDLLRGLCERGFAKSTALHLANRLGSLANPDEAWSQAQAILARQLPVADDQLLEYGGIAALVGPTGVGKTTTIAKLAAKFRLRHGPRHVALVTVDNYRIAAHDHLRTYGRLLDMPVAVASNAEELQRVLQGFLDKKLILIDTAGMGQRDARLMEQLSLLRDSSIPIKPYLVLSASTQARALHEVVRAFSGCGPQASIITKLDEAASPAAALSVLMDKSLPLSFVADGQQVPEDLHIARAEDLIQRCFNTPVETEESSDGFAFEDWVANGAL